MEEAQGRKKSFIFSTSTRSKAYLMMIIEWREFTTKVSKFKVNGSNVQKNKCKMFKGNFEKLNKNIKKYSLEQDTT